jgi:hypothetical protein
MSKILITGMSASHSSEKANLRSLSFAGAIKLVLEQQGHEVIQANPEVSWNLKDLEQYDSVLVGISPLTSLSANHVYGALSVMDVLLNSPKLHLFIDAPEPAKITASLRAMVKTPDNLTKPFYAYRRGFSSATQPNMLQNLIDVVDDLLNKKWPTTLYPALPWTDSVKHVADYLPEGAADLLVGINVDAYLISTQDIIETERREKWVVENYSTKWVKSTTATLSYPTVPMKWNKAWTDAQVSAQISSGLGALIPPYSSSTWWSYRYIQCMNDLTPIATDWKESQLIGSSWAHLASSIEGMTQEERTQLAKDQRDSYIENVPTRRDAAVNLSQALDLFTRKEQTNVHLVQ